MIRWITENLGTAAYEEVIKQSNMHIVDVRDMVDKTGNLANVAREKLEEALSHLNQGEKVIVCCDYGMSRSNAIAAGVLARSAHISFNDAVRQVMLATGEKGMKIEVLSAVREVIEGDIDIDANNNIGSKKRILVTGGSGFIGSALIPNLRKRYDVFAPKREEIDLVKGTVDLDLLVKEQEVECIIHLANPRVYSTNEAMGDTLVMLKNVLDVCVENDLKLIFPSSWEVFLGYRSDRLIASENLAPLPVKTYGETKYLCEKLIEHYHSIYELEFLIIRFSYIYGEGNKPQFLFNFIEKARKNEKIITHKYLNGYPSLDLMHINDALSALKLAYEKEITGVLNIGTGIGITTRYAAEKIVELLDSSSDVESVEIEGYSSNVVFDCKRAEKKLSWTPKINFEDGIKEYIKTR